MPLSVPLRVQEDGNDVVLNTLATNFVEPDTSVVTQSPTGFANVDLSKYFLVTGSRSATGVVDVEKSVGTVFTGTVTTESFPRVEIKHDQIGFGDGTGAVDTVLRRSAADEWTADDLMIFDGAAQIPSGQKMYWRDADDSNFIAFQAGAMTNDTTYTWPTDYPSVAGYVLSSDLSGNLSWVLMTGGGGGGTVVVQEDDSTIDAAAATLDFTEPLATIVTSSPAGEANINLAAYLLASGARALSGNLDLNTNLLINIGASGTDFTTGGGLNLAAQLKLAAGVLLKFDDSDSSNFTAFQTGNQSTDVTYTLPTAAPAVTGYVLSGTTGGVLSWVPQTAVTPLLIVQEDDSTVSSACSTLDFTEPDATLITESPSGEANVDMSLYLLRSGARAMTGNLNFGNNLALNIGAAGTDFTAGGGLTLASTLTLTGFTDGAVLFANGSAAVSQDVPHFYWDRTNFRLAVGHQETTLTSNASLHGATVCLHTSETTDDTGLLIYRHSQFGSAVEEITLARSKGTDALPTIVSSGHALGSIGFYGYDGTDYEIGAKIQATVEGTPGSNDMPGRLSFFTTQDGSNAVTEAVRIDPNQLTTFMGGIKIAATKLVTYRDSDDSNFTAFQAGNQSTDVTYTWPTAAPSVSGQVLSATTGGVMSWASAAATIIVQEDDTNVDTAVSTLDFTEPLATIVTSSPAGEANIDLSQYLLASGARAVSGRLGIGDDETTITITGVSNDVRLAVQPQTDSIDLLLWYHSATAATAPVLALARSRGTDGAETVVAADDALGYIRWYGHDGTDYEIAAAIRAEVDGTPGSNDMPGRLLFLTTADGSNALTERMRISNQGFVTVGTGGTFTLAAGSGDLGVNGELEVNGQTRFDDTMGFQTAPITNTMFTASVTSASLLQAINLDFTVQATTGLADTAFQLLYRDECATASVSTFSGITANTLYARAVGNQPSSYTQHAIRVVNYGVASGTTITSGTYSYNGLSINAANAGANVSGGTHTLFDILTDTAPTGFPGSMRHYSIKLNDDAWIVDAPFWFGTAQGCRIEFDGTNWLFDTPGTVGEVSFNESGTDTDHRIESNDKANMFFLDAGNNRIGIGDTNTPGSLLELEEVTTLSAGLGDGLAAMLMLDPGYTGAFTVTRHNFIKMENPSTAASAVVTDACAMWFDAAIGTHKAIDSGTTKVSGNVVTAWVKININGTVHYMPAYASKTT